MVVVVVLVVVVVVVVVVVAVVAVSYGSDAVFMTCVWIHTRQCACT